MYFNLFLVIIILIIVILIIIIIIMTTPPAPPCEPTVCKFIRSIIFHRIILPMEQLGRLKFTVPTFWYVLISTKQHFGIY